MALWSHQVRNGQLLTFSKAKGLGAAWQVYQLGGLARLPPNSRVTFTWVRTNTEAAKIVTSQRP